MRYEQAGMVQRNVHNEYATIGPLSAGVSPNYLEKDIMKSLITPLLICIPSIKNKLETLKISSHLGGIPFQVFHPEMRLLLKLIVVILNYVLSTTLVMFLLSFVSKTVLYVCLHPIKKGEKSEKYNQITRFFIFV